MYTSQFASALPAAVWLSLAGAYTQLRHIYPPFCPLSISELGTKGTHGPFPS